MTAPKSTHTFSFAKKTTKKQPLERDLPLVDYVFEQYAHVDLSKTLIICMQHLYETTYTMFQKLFSLGLQPSNLIIFGKCYSTDPRVYKNLKMQGAHVHPLSFYFDSHSSYDKDTTKHIQQALQDIIDHIDLKAYEKVIVIDDGGFLIHTINEIFPKDIPLVAVEQTSAGYNNNKDKDLFFPVINVARSWLKKEYETPIIINLALQKIREKIAQLESAPKKILVVGGGFIGGHVYRSLKDDYDVSCFDNDPEKSTIPHEEFETRLEEFDLIIGATGTTSIPKTALSMIKKPVVFASISSSDREFDILHLRQKTDPVINCHATINIDNFTILNGGFPVNFDQDYAVIDHDLFQISRALIFSATCHAFLTEKTLSGFIDYDHNFQKELEKQIHHHQLICKKTPSSLLAPLEALAEH